MSGACRSSRRGHPDSLRSRTIRKSFETATEIRHFLWFQADYGIFLSVHFSSKRGLVALNYFGVGERKLFLSTLHAVAKAIGLEAHP